MNVRLVQRGGNTLPETNIAPGNGWLEYYFPIGEAYFRGYVSFRECIFLFFFALGFRFDVIQCTVPKTNIAPASKPSKRKLHLPS